MDGDQASALNETRPVDGISSRFDGTPRSFLFLQGPISTCFHHLGRALIARGHRVHRINLHFGDQLFWRLPATHFRGRFADWRGFVADIMVQHQITDLVLHGDRRPYHLVAAEEARARGIAVIATDLGYVRPDWITLEYDGMTTYSRFPRDPDEIRALAAEFPEPDLRARFRTPFWLIAALDVVYNLGLVFGRPLYPHYRYHSLAHPFAEYAGWLWSRWKRLFTARAAAREKARLQAAPRSYFLVPLQLAADYQIRAHSPFCDEREAVREIIASFAASGSRRELVFVVHPLDNGLIGWSRLIGRLGSEFGVAEQVQALDGGTPAELLCNAAGVVTINSTIGVTALDQGVPVKVLGNAVFDIAGLTSQAPLDAFWHAPQRPDPELMAAFLRALVGTTQVKGGYYERASQACAVAGLVERLEQRPHPLPPLRPRPPRPASRTVVATGVSEGIGLALARAYAEPGVGLCLIGGTAEMLRQTAEDCRHRGAVVETCGPDALNRSSPADYLAALDRHAPVDTLVVYADPAEEPIDSAKDFGIAGLIDAVAEPMRQRGRGEILLVSPQAGRAALGDPERLAHNAAAFLAYGSALRRRLRVAGISVTVVAPRRIGIRLASRLREPPLTIIADDRAAQRVLRRHRRRRGQIALPGLVVLALRVLRLLPLRAGEWVREASSNREPVDEGALAEKTVTGGTGN